MKKRMMKAALAMILVLSMALTLAGCGEKKEEKEYITVFTYGMYIDPDVLVSFTEETGIEVKYEEAPTPEDLYTKYKAGAIQYDIVCTSDYMLQRLITEGELQPINFDNLPNSKYISDFSWNFTKEFDPEAKYTLPYFWGTVGILYDTTQVNGPIDSWEVLFNGEYSGSIIMQDSIRDSFMIGLKYLGYSLNSDNPDEYQEALDLLIAQKPDVQAYFVDETRDEMVAGNAALGIVYSGEAFLAAESNPNLAYCVPKEGSNVWLDSFGITKGCQNLSAAEKYLDYMCRPDIALKNQEYIGYSTPNTAVLEELGDDYRTSPLMPADEETENCEVYLMTPENITELMNELWKELKAS